MKKKKILILLTLLLALTLSMAACGGNAEKAADSSGAEESSTAEESGETEEKAAVVKTIDEIDTEDMHDLPLQIESVTLFDDGSVMIVPLDELRKNAESNNELKDDAMYPFEEIGKVSDIYLVKFGNGGYRTLIALMDDGTLSALSAKELIDDHIAVVMPNLSGREGYTSVEQVEAEDGYGVNGIQEDGTEVELDTVLNF